MSGLPNRAPPEIEPGVTMDDLTTVEMADAAIDRLTMAIASIEEQLGRCRGSSHLPTDWLLRTEKALRIKRFLIPRVQQRRAVLARQAKDARLAADRRIDRSRVEEKRRMMVRTAWDIEPAAMKRVQDVVRERRPDLFDDGEAL